MTNSLPVGHILQNEYKIEKVLGAGGFGITYLARDTNLNYLVVIKEFLPQDMATRDQSRINVTPFTKDTQSYSHLLIRFSEEAQLLAKMRHPNIVKVTRFFKANNTAYFVMEYAEGETLKDYLKRNNTLKEEEILSIMMPILEGAKYVHEQGFLHRDIAPDNIYLTKNGMPILIDFGAARDAIAEESKNISSIVKEGYSSPEQYTINNKQNASSDIYALGAVFYRLITGKVPTNAPQRQTAILNDDVDPIGDISKEYDGKYSPQLLHAVKKALNIRATDRFPSVSEFQNALTGASIVDSRPSTTSRHIASTIQQNGSSDNNGSGKTGLIISFVIVLALLLAGIVYVYMGQTSQNQTITSQTSTIEIPVTSPVPVDTRNYELEAAKKELAELKRKQAEAEKSRLAEAERKKEEVEAERLRQEREEIAKLKEEKARAQREELSRLRKEKAERERQVAESIPKEKVISFSENGIDIHVTYPSHVKAGQKFRITAQMTNNNSRAKQGGLTLSFPDISGGLSGTILRNNFTKIDDFSYPEKIWNQRAGKALRAKYFMVEGWQSNTWGYGQTKTFSVDLFAPSHLSQLTVNLRGILWIRNKHDTRKIPLSSNIYDQQQAYPVKQFSIKIKR